MSAVYLDCHVGFKFQFINNILKPIDYDTLLLYRTLGTTIMILKKSRRVRTLPFIYFVRRTYNNTYVRIYYIIKPAFNEAVSGAACEWIPISLQRRLIKTSPRLAGDSCSGRTTLLARLPESGGRALIKIDIVLRRRGRCSLTVPRTKRQ